MWELDKQVSKARLSSVEWPNSLEKPQAVWGRSFSSMSLFCPAFRKGRESELAFMECMLGGAINLEPFAYIIIFDLVLFAP